MIEPFSERAKEAGMSYGISVAGYDVRLDQDIDIAAGQFCLASTLERFAMPTDVLGIVHDKSTLARMGLALQNTVIEPGWSGWLTLELTNHGPSHLTLQRGSPIAQIVFHRLDQPAEGPGYSGKYQDQARGPQAARFEDFPHAAIAALDQHRAAEQTTPPDKRWAADCGAQGCRGGWAYGAGDPACPTCADSEGLSFEPRPMTAGQEVQADDPA